MAISVKLPPCNYVESFLCIADINFTLRERIFWHSAEEKLALAEALLQQIGIKEIDLVVGHSAGQLICNYS